MTAIQAYVLANITFKDNTLIFDLQDGQQLTMDVPLPKDGVSITKVKIDDARHLVCEMSDSTIIDAGELPGGEGAELIWEAI